MIAGIRRISGRDAMATEPPARRADPRQLSGARAQLCWWDRDGESIIAGTFADVGRGGASLLIDDPPPADLRHQLHNFFRFKDLRIRASVFASLS